VDLKNVPDGVYEGSSTMQPPPPAMTANKTVTVRVTMAAGRFAEPVDGRRERRNHHVHGGPQSDPGRGQLPEGIEAHHFS
jgi:hypothetical protein